MTPSTERTNPRLRAVDLSLVVPAYNEEARLPVFLATARAYLDSTFANRYEVIVVDDGSHDETAQYLESATAVWPELCFVRHMANLGKGAAVKSGMACAVGDLCLFADADGATAIEEEALLREAIARGADMALGSRLMAPARGQPRRSLVRRIVAWIFAALVRGALDLPLLDTQCGFKLFHKAAAERLFSQLTERGFAFDVELAALARLNGYEVVEVPVAWCDVPGSKVRIIRDSWRMLKSLVAIRRRMRTWQPLSDKRPTARPTPRGGPLPDGVDASPTCFDGNSLRDRCARRLSARLSSRRPPGVV